MIFRMDRKLRFSFSLCSSQRSPHPARNSRRSASVPRYSWEYTIALRSFTALDDFCLSMLAIALPFAF